MTPFNRWLSEATRGLSPESAAQARTEIQEHYDLARETGGDAIADLGDPRATNRAYRKVLLTEHEAVMARVLTQPHQPSVANMLLTSALLAAFLWRMAPKHPSPGLWPVMIAIFCPTPLNWFFRANTIARTRIYLWVHGVRNIVVIGTAWWYQGWISALTLGALCFLGDYFVLYRRLSVFRKLAAGQTYGPLAGEPQLTHLEAVYLSALHKGGSAEENATVTVLFVMLTAMTVWMPATFAPMAIWTAAGYVTRRTLSIYTEERSRWLRFTRWTTMAVAAVLPALYGARQPWLGAVELAVFFVLLDMRGISLRRKLPVAQWPKRLYW